MFNTSQIWLVGGFILYKGNYKISSVSLDFIYYEMYSTKMNFSNAKFQCKTLHLLIILGISSFPILYIPLTSKTFNFGT